MTKTNLRYHAKENDLQDSPEPAGHRQPKAVTMTEKKKTKPHEASSTQMMLNMQDDHIRESLKSLQLQPVNNSSFSE